MWVLWEAWDRRPEYHDAFSERAPSQVAQLRELEASGKARGWFKRVRNIRDYMNHRDKRGYLDPGREELSDEAIAWLHDLRRAFSELLLAAMGIPLPRWEFSGFKGTMPRNSTIREIATSAVDDLLIGAIRRVLSPLVATVSAMHAGAEDGPDATVAIIGHFGRAFTVATSGSPQLWSESLTSLIRRSVVARSRLGEVPQLRQLVENIELEHNGQIFLAAITTSPADEAELLSLSSAGLQCVEPPRGSTVMVTCGRPSPLRSRSRALTSAVNTLKSDDVDVGQFVQQLGVAADALLVDG